MRHLAVALVTVVVTLRGAGAAEPCVLHRIGDLPLQVAANGLPLVHGATAGVETDFRIALGTFESSVYARFAKVIGVEWRALNAATSGADQKWVGVGRTTLPDLQIGQRLFGPTKMLVLGAVPPAPNVGGTIGLDTLGRYDIEIDIAEGMLRLFDKTRCQDVGPYWSKRYAEVPMQHLRSRYYVDVEINGKPFRALVSTDASRSVVKWSVARQLGLTPESPSVRKLADGRGLAETFSVHEAQFRSFRIGEETIHEPVFGIVETVGTELAEVTLGTDFFAAHRVYLAPEARRMLFTYNGRPFAGASGQP